MKIKNVKVYGLEESKIRSGYPKQLGDVLDMDEAIISNKVDARAKSLANTPVGSGHGTFLKGIIVQFDMLYPEYIAPQILRYNHIDIISSQSKMHKLTSVDKFTQDMFAGDTCYYVIDMLNDALEMYKCANSKEKKKELELLMYNNLPSGYLKWWGISTNYLQLKTIYKQRRKHKLPEWQYFCDWIETLPESNLITD